MRTSDLIAISDPIPSFAPEQKVVNMDCGSQATPLRALWPPRPAVSNPAQHPSTARGVFSSSAFRGCSRPPRRQTRSQGRRLSGLDPYRDGVARSFGHRPKRLEQLLLNISQIAGELLQPLARLAASRGCAPARSGRASAALPLGLGRLAALRGLCFRLKTRPADLRGTQRPRSRLRG